MSEALREGLCGWGLQRERERQEFSPVETSHRVKEGLVGKRFHGPCPGQAQGSVWVSRQALSKLAVSQSKGGEEADLLDLGGGGWPAAPPVRLGFVCALSTSGNSSKCSHVRAPHLFPPNPAFFFSGSSALTFLTWTWLELMTLSFGGGVRHPDWLRKNLNPLRTNEMQGDLICLPQEGVPPLPPKLPGRMRMWPSRWPDMGCPGGAG